MNKLCPCSNDRLYQDCCQPFHTRKSDAQTAEQLMRSRYSAFVLADIDYLFDTLHPAQRQPNERSQLAATIHQTDWLGLTILDAKESEVEFVAFYQTEGIQQLHERSHFEYDDGKWFYVDGMMMKAIKLGRNEPCVCGSGKKLKHCHG